VPLSLEQYATWLDSRGLPWPAPPTVEPAKAKAHLKELHGIRAVLWGTYGTILAISTGDLVFEHPQQMVLDIALDKTIDEFKMWGSMSRKPGRPSEYMRHLYLQELLLHKASTGGERYPEVLVERVWENLVKKLFQKDYKFDAGFYGSINEYSKKIAYFFHASMQGTAAQPEAAHAIRLVADFGKVQGLFGDGQCFTSVQLNRGLRAQDSSIAPDVLLPDSLRILSCDVKARKPSDTVFRAAMSSLSAKGIRPEETLHIGARMTRDIIPAKKLGMRTALYAGDRSSLEASAEQMKDAAVRPDVLLTDLSQLANVLA
jgi:hypothetical protein